LNLNAGTVYHGQAPALTDLFSGRPRRLSTSGLANALAVTTVTRSRRCRASGCRRFLAGLRTERVARFRRPKDTPAEIIDKLNKEIKAGLADPKLKARLANLGSEPLAGSPADFGNLIADETEK
jgi:hypothetical protein